MMMRVLGDCKGRGSLFPLNYTKQSSTTKLLYPGAASCSGGVVVFDALSRYHPSAHTAECVGYFFLPRFY